MRGSVLSQFPVTGHTGAKATAETGGRRSQMEMLAAAWTCLPVAATVSVFWPLPSLLQITELQMRGRVAGVPLPVRGPVLTAVESSSLAALLSRCGRKPETQTGMREGLVTAARRADLGA